jgi:hypothetical protein
MRRLNRAEYNNTIRDLLGVPFEPAADFPVDDVGYGFDNIGDVLTLPPLLMEKYLNAAEKIAESAIRVPQRSFGTSRKRLGRELEGGARAGESGRILASRGAISGGFDLPADGLYRVLVTAYGDQAGDEPPKMVVKVDGRGVQTFEVRAVRGVPGEYEVRLPLKKGKRRLDLEFTNDYYNEKAPEHHRDRNLVVESLDLQGPATRPMWEIAKVRGRGLEGGKESRGSRAIISSGEVWVDQEFPAKGEYRLVVTAFGQQAGPDPCKMSVRVDDRDPEEFDVPNESADPGEFEVLATLSKGKHRISIRFLNDYYEPDDPDPKLRGDRNLYAREVRILGPEPANLPESHRKVVVKTPEGDNWRDAAKANLEPFMSRAFRRPVRPDELGRVLDLVEMVHHDDLPFERAMQVAVEAVLVNPHFLYRVEVDRRRRGGDRNKNPNDGLVRDLNDYELATRLSYFLWSSMPDEELFRLAKQGKLHEDGTLEGQVKRMLKDPKSEALVENFAQQWLTLRNLASVSPNRRQFRRFDDELREAMMTETELFFESVMRDDRSVLEFLDSDYTFLNEPLAELYGIKGVEGDEFRRVSLKPESHRGGLLTQASILTVTSNPTRTSPVKRGKWVLEQLLGTPPPPQPPDVPELEEGPELKGTLRERMEQHRANPACAGCHARMDPIGFGFENFDAIGHWRETDGGSKIDPSGELPSGRTFQGPDDFRRLLVEDMADQFTRNLAEKMMTYALGRGLEYYDDCAVDEVVKQTASDGHKFSRLVVSIVQSEPFRKRKREEGSTP